MSATSSSRYAFLLLLVFSCLRMTETHAPTIQFRIQLNPSTHSTTLPSWPVHPSLAHGLKLHRYSSSAWTACTRRLLTVCVPGARLPTAQPLFPPTYKADNTPSPKPKSLPFLANMCLHRPFHPAYRIPLDCLKSVLTYLSIKDLENIRSAGDTPFPDKEVIFAAWFHVREQLRLITPNDLEFSDVLLKTNSVISGSRSISVAEPRFHHLTYQSDFDLYTPINQHHTVINYLLAKGYVSLEFDHYVDNLSHIKSCTTLCNPDTERFVDVMESVDDSPISPITRFHSTPVRTFLFSSHKTLY